MSMGVKNNQIALEANLTLVSLALKVLVLHASVIASASYALVESGIVSEKEMIKTSQQHCPSNLHNCMNSVLHYLKIISAIYTILLSFALIFFGLNPASIGSNSSPSSNPIQSRVSS